jgi:hypothetical protein
MAPHSRNSVVRFSSGHSVLDDRIDRTPGRATNVNVHRFEEIINGRPYRIEVSSVGAGQWRAQIARVPGGSAALMPFYGKTPDEAAQQLSRWLCIVHGQARGSAPTVASGANVKLRG